jgi:FkbM family methyltransferase
MNVITCRRLDFDLQYTLSRSSTLAARLLRLVTVPRGRYGLRYPLYALGLIAGGSAAILSRLLEPLSRNKVLDHLTANCDSIAVGTKISSRILCQGRANLGLSRAAAAHAALLSRQPGDIDLFFNTNPEFTKWVVSSGSLREAFVVLDVGVLGGENPRWHFLGDHLVVHGFDAIKEAITELRAANPGKNKVYHPIAIGNENGERRFFVDPSQRTNSSFSESHGADARLVQIRSLDALLNEGVIPQADFLKVDVEGFERDVLLGAQHLLSGGVLGMEVETNFRTSSDYPKSHFATIYDLVLDHGLHLFDLNFDREVRPSYGQAKPPPESAAGAGMPSTFNILFCRDLPGERDSKRYYTKSVPHPTVDQVLKMMIIYELHGLSDVAVETAETFAKELKTRRIDVGQAIELLRS